MSGNTASAGAPMVAERSMWMVPGRVATMMRNSTMITARPIRIFLSMWPPLRASSSAETGPRARTWSPGWLRARAAAQEDEDAHGDADAYQDPQTLGPLVGGEPARASLQRAQDRLQLALETGLVGAGAHHEDLDGLPHQR